MNSEGIMPIEMSDRERQAPDDPTYMWTPGKRSRDGQR